LSGLAAAWQLADAGFSVEVFETADRPGGLIETIDSPHGPIERAANAFVWTPAVATLFQSLDLAPRFASPDARRRYIFRDGRPRRWPLHPSETLTMGLRAAGAALARRSAPVGSEGVLDWGHRVWGRAATRWLIAPALQGIYAARADDLAAGAVFGSAGSSLARRGRASLLAAPWGGMSVLMNRLVDRLRYRGVRFSFGTHLESLDPSVPTVVATSATAAGPLVAPHAPDLGAAIARLPMTTIGMATAVFPQRDDDLRGFGVLFPRGCGVDALGVRFDSDVLPVDGNRTWRVETWISRVHDASSNPSGSSRLWQTVANDRRLLTGRSEEPHAVFTVCRPRALPVYSAGVLDIQQHLAELPPWLALAGNYMGRLGASKLLDVAGEAAGRIARFTASAS
jgi:oxygen-dependent protoporphyrinogen oxidase